MPDPQFPIGRFDFPGQLNAEQREHAIDEMVHAPRWLCDAVDGLSQEQLDTPYRPKGWTVRQVVHHLPDSHANSYIRFKLALTEDRPLVRVYDERRWAELPDAAGPIELSLRLLESIHERLVYLVRRVDEEAWQRPLLHPELGQMRLDELLAFYAWHGRHHVAHITTLRARMDW